MSDDDPFQVNDPVQDEQLEAAPGDLYATPKDEDEDDSAPKQAESASSEDENDARYVLHVFVNQVVDQSLAHRDETLECLEDFVLSFLTKLSDALPDAYSQSKGQSSNPKKITLQLADRRKQSSDEHVHS